MKRIAETQMKKNIKLVPSEFYHLKYKVSTGKHEKFSGKFRFNLNLCKIELTLIKQIFRSARNSDQVLDRICQPKRLSNHLRCRQSRLIQDWQVSLQPKRPRKPSSRDRGIFFFEILIWA